MIANGRMQLYPVMRLALMLVLGIVTGDALSASVPVAAWLAAAAVAVAAALCLWRHAVAQGCMLMAAVFLLGCCLVGVETRRLSPAVSGGGEEAYEAVVMTKPVVRGRTVRCVLLVSRGRLAGHKVMASFLSSPADGRAAALRVGDGVSAVSRFEAPRARAGASSRFDYARWLKVQGVSAVTFLCYDAWKQAVTDISGISVADKMRLRAACLRERVIGKCLGSELSGQHLAVVSAMALGDKSQLSAATKETYSVSGASHLLALSGLHLGIIYAVLSLVLVSRRRQWTGRVAVMAALWAYVVVVGMMPSVVRAATMFTFHAVASMFRRPQLSLNAWAFAAFAILLASPLSVWDVGFQLSFMAVAGIMVLFGPLYGMAEGGRLLLYRPLKWGWTLVVVSFSAQLAVAPLVAFHFGRLQCYFLLTNLVAVPLAVFVLYASLAAVVSVPLPWLHVLAAGCINAAVWGLDAFLGWVSRLPGASIGGIGINAVQTVLVYALMACVFFLVRYAARFRRSAHGLRRGCGC